MLNYLSFSKKLPLSENTTEKKAENNIKTEDPLIHLVVVGDIMLSRNVGQKMLKYKDYQYPFLATQDFLKSADIAFGNLESPLLAGPQVESSSLIFRADPECAPALVASGFNVLSLANNHIMNQGPEGLLNTLVLLTEAGAKGVGAGTERGKAHQAAIIEKNGLKVAFLAYAYPGNQEAQADAPGVAIMKIADLEQDLKEAKDEADVVIVSMHAGTEYSREPNQKQIDFGHAAIDHGADLVIGHHPHWIQPIEKYKNKYIIYSLGNFIFDQTWSPETQEGLVASIDLNREGVQSLEFLPVRIFDSSQPRFVEGEAGERILKRLNFKP